LSGLFATQGNAFETLDASDALFDARARLVEGACEKGWFVALVGFVGESQERCRPRRFAISLAGVAFIADDGARLNVGTDIEQDIKMTRVGGFAAGQVEAMMSPEASDFAWIFVVKPPRERPSACPSCPLGSGGRHRRAHDGRVEHLDQMRGRTH
jgi:hypothetical protein